MKLLAKILLIAAAAVALCAVWLLWVSGWEVWRQYVALEAIRTREFTNPVGTMVGGAALALVAGFIGGFAVAQPRRPKKVAPQDAATATPPADPGRR